MNLPVDFLIDFNEVYLAYVDPVSNALKEIDPSTLYLKMSPFERVIRRFYVCSNQIDATQITAIASIDGPQKHAYDVKVRLGYNYSNLNSFINSSNIDNVIVNTAQNYYDNAIPIDIYIESFNKTETCNVLDISINVSDHIQPG